MSSNPANGRVGPGRGASGDPPDSEPADSGSSTDGAPSLATLLAMHRDFLERWLTKHASGLLRYEAAEDLVQGVHLQALEGEARFQYRSDREFMKWLEAVARQHVADRHAYWSAGKRSGALLLRLTARGGDTQATRGSRSVDPPSGTRGPATRAAGGDDLDLAARAIAMLLPRDQELVKAAAESVTIEALAKRLGITIEAAGRARLRALDRFRKTFELLAKRPPN